MGGIFGGQKRIIAPAAIKKDFLSYNGSYDLLVDGSDTPVEFSYEASSNDATIVYIDFILVSPAIRLGLGGFGRGRNSLTNGLQVKITSNGSTGTIATLKTNEDLIHFSSPCDFNVIIAGKDLIRSTFVLDRDLMLRGGTSDKVSIVVQDDLSSNIANYFRCGIYLVEEEL